MIAKRSLMKRNNFLQVICCIKWRSILIASMFLSSLILSRAYAMPPDKTLVYCSESSPRGFDPAQSITAVEYSAGASTIYNRLIEFERGTTNIGAGLATYWDISPDGLEYTFYLRRGVKFHTTRFFTPTREFNADDVLFTFERMRDSTHPFFKSYSVSYPYFTNLGFDKEITKIEKLDQYTVRFTLKSVNAPFLMAFGLPFASILSAEYAEQLLNASKAADINQHPIGTGPFVFVDYTKDTSIRFDGNSDYWKPEDVKVSKLLFLITLDPAVTVQKLKNHECHVMSYPNPSELDFIRTDPSLRLLSQSGLNLSYLVYNVSNKPLDNLLVRRALDMAINKKAIIKAVFHQRDDAAQIAHTLIPPALWPYVRTLEAESFDLEKAKTLLAQAGYPKGFSISLWTIPVPRPYNPNPRLTAEMIQADWSKIGVKANIVSHEWGEYIKQAREGKHDALLMGWVGNVDLDNWFGVLLTCGATSGSNFSKWCNRPFDDLVKKARKTIDPMQREIFYKEAEQIFRHELPLTPIWHATIYQPINKKVTNFKINPLSAVLFTGVSLE